MHELGLCQSLLRQLQTIAAQHISHKITRAYLQVGPLCGVDPALMRQAFHMARKGTEFAEVTLQIEATPIRLHCPQCDQPSITHEPNHLTCAHCGHTATQLLSGEELLLRSVDIIPCDEPAPIEMN